MDGRTAAAHVGTIHDVVVEQREVMEHLYGCSLVEGASASVGCDGVGHGERQHRTYPFASGLEGVADRVVESGWRCRNIKIAYSLFGGCDIFFEVEHLLLCLFWMGCIVS